MHPTIGLVIITAGICGICAAEGGRRVATNAAGQPVVINDGAAMVPVTTIVVDPAAHPIEKAAAKNCRATWCGSAVCRCRSSSQRRPFPSPRYDLCRARKGSRSTLRACDTKGTRPDGFLLRVATATLWRRAGTIAELLMPYTDCSSTWAAVSTPEKWSVPTATAVTVPSPFELKSSAAFEWRAMLGTIAP